MDSVTGLCLDYFNFGICKFGKGCSMLHCLSSLQPKLSTVPSRTDTTVANKSICPHYTVEICYYSHKSNSRYCESDNRHRKFDCPYIHLTNKLFFTIPVTIAFRSKAGPIYTKDGIEFGTIFTVDSIFKYISELSTPGNQYLIPVRKRFARYSMYLDVYLFLLETLNYDIAIIVMKEALHCVGFIDIRNYKVDWRYRVLPHMS